jgi:hypothetical protein
MAQRQDDVGMTRTSASRDPIDQPALSSPEPPPAMRRGRGGQQPTRSVHGPRTSSLLSRGHASRRGGSYRVVGNSALEPNLPVHQYVPLFMSIRALV